MIIRNCIQAKKRPELRKSGMERRLLKPKSTMKKITLIIALTLIAVSPAVLAGTNPIPAPDGGSTGLLSGIAAAGLFLLRKRSK